MISQLPTYTFKKKVSSEDLIASADNEATADNEYKNYCTVCLEKFEEE